MAQGYSVISISRPGYYRTPISVGADLEEQSEALNAFLDAIGKEQVFVLGFSGGGPLAAQFSIDYPNRVKKLVLISAVLDEFEDDAAQSEQDVFASNFSAWMASQAFAFQVPDKELTDPAKAYLRNTLLPVSETEDGRLNDMRVFMSDVDLDFQNLNVPTLLVHGTDDPVVPFSQSLEASQEIPDAELLAMEGKDHFQVVFFEYEQTLREVATYLAK